MTRRHARPDRPSPAQHQPEPVDIASESAAGEEDPGASVEPPPAPTDKQKGAERPDDQKRE